VRPLPQRRAGAVTSQGPASISGEYGFSDPHDRAFRSKRTAVLAAAGSHAKLAYAPAPGSLALVAPCSPCSACSRTTRLPQGRENPKITCLRPEKRTRAPYERRGKFRAND
jgi:hypothetical protein